MKKALDHLPTGAEITAAANERRAKELGLVGEPQNAQEPVAWRVDGVRHGEIKTWFYWKSEWPTMHEEYGDKVTPLYAAPPARSSDESAGVREALMESRQEIERQLHRCNSDEEAGPYEATLAKIDRALALLQTESRA